MVISGTGKNLDDNTQGNVENRFGYDFGNVKIHNGSLAAKSATSVNAHAYTSGNQIVFNEGKYNPSTHEGKKLLAHELTHVVQQGKDIATKRVPTTTCSRANANTYSSTNTNANSGSFTNRRPEGYESSGLSATHLR